MESHTWVGRQIDQYEIREHIASGGMADVYLAYDVHLHRYACLKVMLLKLLQEPEYVARFQREAQAMALVEHRHIIRIYGTGVTPTGQPYIAMEYVDGGSLEEVTTRLAQRGEHLSPVHILILLRAVALGLSAVHQAHLVHRDLKPSNILVRRDGEPVVADLGIVAVEEATRLTHSGRVPGTPRYMAPEQAAGEKVDGRTDIYALGVILYELLAGQPPFVGPDTAAVLHQHLVEEPVPLQRRRPGLTRATYQVAQTCLQKAPAARYQTAAALATALEQAILAERAERRPSPFAAWRANRRPAWWLLALAPLIILLLAWGMNQNRPPVPLPSGATRLPSPTPTVTTAAVLVSTLPTFTPVIPTPIPEPTPTDTATPTPEAPSPTPITPTPTATRFIPIPTILTVPSSPTPTPCTLPPASRWQTIYTVYQASLGCPLSPETSTSAAYQLYPGGLMIWRGDIDSVYVLYNDGAFDAVNAANFSLDYTRTPTQQGAFGYLWLTNEGVRNRLGVPTESEAVASDFVAQDFSGGVIFYFLENGSQTYMLHNTSRQWFLP